MIGSVADGHSGAARTCVLCGATERRRLFVKHEWVFARCTGCGLVSLDPPPTAEALAAHHEASYLAGGYAAFADAEPVRVLVARERLRRVTPLAGPGPWLDVGASTGAFVAAAGALHDVEGIEVSPEAVRRARLRNLRVRCVAVEDFEPDQRYGLVTAFDVVEHLPDPGRFLARVARWLAPGGRLVLTVPNVGSVTARLLGRHWFYYAAPDHVHYFTPATIRWLLERAGFADVASVRVAKPLPLDYAAAQLERLGPLFAPVVRCAAKALPPRWRTRPLPLPLGEMLVSARPAVA